MKAMKLQPKMAAMPPKSSIRIPNAKLMSSSIIIDDAVSI